MAAEYLSKSFHAGSGLIASIVALYACVMLIEVIRRIRLAERDLAIGWTLHGALSIGSGLWAAHFLGLFSLDLPIEVGYDKTLTVLSWLPSVLSIAVILSFMGRPHQPAHWRIVGGLVWAVGVSLTLYLGIASMGIHTGIDWDAGILLGVGLPALAVLVLGSVMIRRTLDGGIPVTPVRLLM
ncbi:MAG TPA: MHYT domain-containing protein, partial [Aquabacterium sp.]|nr:MHYT domain-containing protein [Aquabacterium sp.]